jgi:hypothetical protein
MGWSGEVYPVSRTKKEFVEKELKSFENSGYEVHAHKSTSSGLYAVMTTPKGEKFLMCAMIRKESNGGFMIKTMEESMGPCMYDCPLSFLEMLPEATGYAVEWREKVRAYHESKKAKKSIGEGSRVYIDGNKEEVFKVGPKYNTRSYIIVSEANGARYKCPKNRMSPVEVQ